MKSVSNYNKALKKAEFNTKFKTEFEKKFTEGGLKNLFECLEMLYIGMGMEFISDEYFDSKVSFLKQTLNTYIEKHKDLEGNLSPKEVVG